MTKDEILTGLSTENLIEKLKETSKNIKLMGLNVDIQIELEKRIGEDKIDAILDEIRG